MFSIQGLRIFIKPEISTVQRRLKMTLSGLSLYGSGLARQVLPTKNTILTLFRGYFKFYLCTILISSAVIT